MTYQGDFALPSELLDQIAVQGFDVLPELIRIVIDAAMQAERQQYLRAAPYQLSPGRRGHANGYKPKTAKTRLGEITWTYLKFMKAVSIPNRWRRGSAASGPLP